MFSDVLTLTGLWDTCVFSSGQQLVWNQGLRGGGGPLAAVVRAKEPLGGIPTGAEERPSRLGSAEALPLLSLHGACQLHGDCDGERFFTP